MEVSQEVQKRLDQVAKLPAPARAGIIALIALLIGGFYYFSVYQSTNRQLQALHGQELELQRKLSEVRSIAANIAEFEEEITNLELKLSKVLRQLPNDKELPVLLTDITTLGKNAGLEFKSFIPQAEIKKGFYAEVPISISLTGGFHELARFFDELSHLDRIVNVQDFNIEDVKVRPNAIELAISGVATTFRFVSEAEMKADEAAANPDAA